MEECPNCGEGFERLGLHWWHGTCPYPELDRVTRDRLTGLLMGDASIPVGGDRTANNILHLPMINRRFLEWFDREMGVMTTGVTLKKTAAERARINRESGFSPTARPENYHDIYTIWTRTHPYVTELRRWYDSGRKRFPEDLVLTPTIAKYWYICDGCMDLGQWGTGRVSIKNRTEDPRLLEELFTTKGFDPTYRRSELVFKQRETARLLSWMGPAPPGFEYKWELESRERYRELKEEAYSRHATQTFE